MHPNPSQKICGLFHKFGTFLLASCTVVLSITSENTAYSAEKNRIPNIVMILVDDLGYGELGCYGGKEIPTPHMDALAAVGVRFTDGYVTAPFCAASRAGLFTGRYQTRFGFEFNPIGATNSDPKIGLPVGERTFADKLRDVGYVTALVGKWHLGGTAAYHPQRRGFDQFFGFLHEGHYYVPPPFEQHTTWLRRKALPDGGQGRWMSADGRTIWSTHMGHREPDYDADNPILRGSQPVDEKENLTDAFTREACRFIRRHAEQPFLLCVNYNAVHSPLQADEKYLPGFEKITDPQRRIFAAMLSQLDDRIGQLRQELEKAGLRDNTLLVLLSDNGGPTKELTSSNLPLRGGKGELYEGGVRVPMLVAWPGTIPAGKVVHEPVNSLDLAATILAAGGCDAKRGDGRDLLPFLTGDASVSLPERDFFWRVGKKFAIRSGSWKLIGVQGGNRSPELFDLASDLAETNDLSARNVSQADRLLQLWEQWNAGQVAPLW